MIELVINKSMNEEMRDALPDEIEQEETQEDTEVEESAEDTDTEDTEDDSADEATVLKEKLDKTAKELRELREWKKRQLKRQKVAKPQPVDLSVKEEVEEIKLKMVNPNLTDEDISEIRKYAKGAGISALEALKNPIFSAGLEQIMSQRKAEQAVPKAKKRSISGVDVSTLDLENPEDVKLLRENPELKAKFLERLNSKR